MKYSGLYFLPFPASGDSNNPILQTLLSNIRTKYPSAANLDRWALHHRLLRSIPDTAPQNNPPPPSAYQHFLNLSYQGVPYTYVYIHTPTADAQVKANAQPAIIAIPDYQSEAHFSLLAGKLSASWAPRQFLSLRDGHAFDIGEVEIRIGELRLVRYGTPGNVAPTVPGIVVCISTMLSINDSDHSQISTSSESSRTLSTGEPSNAEWEEGVQTAQTMVRGFWGTIKEGVEAAVAKDGVKEVMMDAPWEDFTSGTLEQREMKQRWAEIRLWCEVLRLRA